MRRASGVRPGGAFFDQVRAVAVHDPDALLEASQKRVTISESVSHAGREARRMPRALRWRAASAACTHRFVAAVGELQQLDCKLDVEQAAVAEFQVAPVRRLARELTLHALPEVVHVSRHARRRAGALVRRAYQRSR